MRHALAAVVLFMAGSAQAATVIIDSTPTESSGGFQHNVFHTASSNGGAGGSILAWFDLDTTATNTWDQTSGNLTMSVNLYSSSSLTTLIGTAVATSSDLLLANFSAPGFQDGGLIGTISWDFDAAAEAISGLSDMTMSFVDHDYATSSGGFNANSVQGDSFTLWGADGTPNLSNGNFTGQTLGVDLTMTTVVPLPAAVWLFASGLGLLGWTRRRQTA